MHHPILSIVAGIALAFASASCQTTQPKSPDAGPAMGGSSAAEHAAHGEPGHDADAHAGADASDSAVPVAFDAPPVPGTRARCPVAGKAFTVSEETVTAVYGGKHYAFCCPGCKSAFEADPRKYAVE